MSDESDQALAMGGDAELKAIWAMIEVCAHTAQLLSIEQLEMVEGTIRLAHAVGPILMPTEYRAVGADNLAAQERLLSGFMAFRRAIEAERAVFEGRNNGS